MEGPTRWNTRNAIWPVNQASIMLLLLLLSLIVMVGSLEGVEEVDKTCQSHETCMPNCALFKEKLKLKNEFKIGSQEREDLVNQIKSQVCNKKKQAFCCPCEDDPCVPTSDCPQVVVCCLVVVVVVVVVVVEDVFVVVVVVVVRARTTPAFLPLIVLRPSIFLTEGKGNGDESLKKSLAFLS